MAKLTVDFSHILRKRLKAEMPLKFTAEVTVKVSGIREAGESNRSTERIMAYVNQPSARGKEVTEQKMCFDFLYN